MSDQYYQQSTRTEYEEVCDRIGKLKALMADTAYKELPEEDRQLIESQLPAMESYAAILVKRINLF